MLTACPPAIAIAGRTSCIVPCVPADACLGSNVCAAGYASKAPYFRCASCDLGYYQLGTVCAKCPDSPYAIIVVAAVIILAAGALGYFLNKKNINIGYVSIGVDWAQVVAIFADAGVPWPPEVRQLLHILSAFNLCAERLPGIVADGALPLTPRPAPAATLRSWRPSASPRQWTSSRSSRLS